MRLAWLMTGLAFFAAGCHTLSPKPIQPTHWNLPEDLQSDYEPTIERGKKRPVIDAIGWVFGIPSKILLWNRKVENHSISPETEMELAQYLNDNQLDEVKVRLNQYRPIDDWRRLKRNTSVAWPLRYTLGTLSVFAETIIPGRVFGGDHYNPFTGTVHVYSDIPVIALHEAAHAKDFARRTYPGAYAAIYLVPGVPLWHESIATSDVLAYVHYQDDPPLIRQAYQVLYPAYGTYVGDSLGYFAPRYSSPLYFAGVLGGHAVGRWKARQYPGESHWSSTEEPWLVRPRDSQGQPQYSETIP